MKKSSKVYFGLSSIALLIVLFWLGLGYKDKSISASDSKSKLIESQFELFDDFSIQLVASEPDVYNPMTMTVDNHGAIYVSESSTYRYGIEGAPPTDVLNPIKRIVLDSTGAALSTTVVAEGFANPVMGIYVYGDKLYATCLNELFVMDIGSNGELTNRKLLVKDAAEPWNPFGMYRVMVGPDAKLWLAIADHPDSKPVELTGSDGKKVRLRGQTGGFVRCNLDGSNIEIMVQGFRAPFVFDIDPWGHLWAISNGEGSPNIYVDVIPGMDYGYHSRDVSFAWLAGKTKLAPPVYEMGPGANTVAFHYYNSMFPSEFWGSIFIGNWGSHGAYPSNRTIDVIFQNDDKESGGTYRKELRKTAELFLKSNDTLFRPVSMTAAPDGGLYLADWNSRDDDSSLTGRIFKINYEGNKNQKSVSKGVVSFNEIEKKGPEELCVLLGNKNQSIREWAKYNLIQSGSNALEYLGQVLMKEDPFAAANAIWTLTSMKSLEATHKIILALDHPDPRIRSLGLRQLRQASGQQWDGQHYSNEDSKSKSTELMDITKLVGLARPLIQDTNAEVRIEAALSLDSSKEICLGLLSALEITSDKRLRYQIGFELGRHGDLPILNKLRNSSDPEMRKIAMIAAQTANNESNALATKIKDWDLTVDQDNEAESLVREIEMGKMDLGTDDLLMAFEWLEENPPKKVNMALIRFLAVGLDHGDALVQEAAMRNLGSNTFHDPLIKTSLLKILNSNEGNTMSKLQIQALYLMGGYLDISSPGDWITWLTHPSNDVVITALRSLRHNHAGSDFLSSLLPSALSVAQRDSLLSDEVWYTFQYEIPKKELDTFPIHKSIRPTDKTELANLVLSTVKNGGASYLMGKLSFDNACAICHAIQPGEGGGLLGPNLANIGVASQPQYLIESILEPSKVLKTGYQVEAIETKDGRTYTGHIEIKDDKIIIRTLGSEPLEVLMDNVKSRTTSHLSLMPSGLDNLMTTGELSDLTLYLMYLRDE